MVVMHFYALKKQIRTTTKQGKRDKMVNHKILVYDKL